MEASGKQFTSMILSSVKCSLFSWESAGWILPSSILPTCPSALNFSVVDFFTGDKQAGTIQAFLCLSLKRWKLKSSWKF